MARSLGDGAWCWFGDPRALFFAGRHRRTYVGWVSRAGEIMVASLDHRTRRLEYFVLERGLSVDDHNSPGLLMGADGRLTVFYMGPGRGSMCYRGDDRAGGRHELGAGGEAADEHARQPRLHLSQPDPPRRGGAHVPVLARRAVVAGVLARDADGGRWSEARTLLRIPDQRPYLKLHSDGVRAIHIAYTEGNPGSFVNSVYYLRYEGDALYRADGRRVAKLADLPLKPSDGHRVYDARRTGVRAWVWDIAARRDGRPVIVFALFPDGSDDCTYMYAEWTSGAWETHPIVDAGGRIGGNYAPGVSLDHDNPNVVYLSRKVGGRFVVQRWRTADRGATWHSARSTPARRRATACARSRRATTPPSATCCGCRATTAATPTTAPTSWPSLARIRLSPHDPSRSTRVSQPAADAPVAPHGQRREDRDDHERPHDRAPDVVAGRGRRATARASRRRRS